MCLCFFCFKQKTAYEMRISDWSSDVCSSDLEPRYVVLAVLDEPKGNKETYGYATGGWVAAPVIHRVVARIAPVLGFAPIDEAAPEIRQEFAIELTPERRRHASF